MDRWMGVPLRNPGAKSCLSCRSRSLRCLAVASLAVRARACAWMVTAAHLYCCACTRAARARAADWMVTVARVVMYR